jgi:hypothetical protein
MLGLINLMTSDYPWFLWPALGWGVGIAFHLWSIILPSLTLQKKWRNFFAHLGPYLITITMLGLINLLTSTYPWYLWPALGWGAAVAIHLWVTILSGNQTREEISKAIVEEDKVEEFEPIDQPLHSKQFANQTFQGHLEKAIAYKTEIARLMQTSENVSSQARLHDLAGQVDEWIEAINNLARRVEAFQQDKLIHQDLASVPQAIEDLEKRLAHETDETTRIELERVLANRKHQFSALNHLQSMMNRAELQIESTLSALGTIYSQILTSQSTNHVADYSRLSTKADEEVHLLQDHLEALKEVKMSRH